MARRGGFAVPAIDTRLLIAGGVLLAIWLLNRQIGGKSLAYNIGESAVDAVGDVAAGGVVAVGKWAGIPETNVSECEAAKARGSAWDASFACPAGDFLSYWWNR